MGEILLSVKSIISQKWIMFRTIVATILNFPEILGGCFVSEFQMAGMKFKTEVKTIYIYNPILRN